MNEKDVPDELTITLRKPVKIGDKTITELNLREPIMSEIERFQKELNGRFSSLEVMNKFIADIAGVPKPFIDLIGGRDGKAAREYLTAFL